MAMKKLDKLPLEHPLREALLIYARRFWIIFLTMLVSVLILMFALLIGYPRLLLATIGLFAMVLFVWTSLAAKVRKKQIELWKTEEARMEKAGMHWLEILEKVELEWSKMRRQAIYQVLMADIENIALKIASWEAKGRRALVRYFKGLVQYFKGEAA